MQSFIIYSLCWLLYILFDICKDHHRTCQEVWSIFSSFWSQVKCNKIQYRLNRSVGDHFWHRKNLEVERNFLTPISNIENSLFDNKFFFSSNRNVLRWLLRQSILSNQTQTISKLTYLAYILPLPKQIFLKQSASHMKMLVWIRFYECCTMLLDKKTVWRFIKSKLGELIFNLDPYFDSKHFSCFLTFCICSFLGKTPLLHLQWSWNLLPPGRWGTILSGLGWP